VAAKPGSAGKPDRLAILRKRLAAAEALEEKKKRVVALKAELKGLTARKPKK